MDFYSGRQPNLIGPIMKSTVCKIMKNPTVNNTVSDKITNYLSDLYKDYIVDNKIIICIILAFVFFLIYRYCNNKAKNTSDKENETKKPKELFSPEETKNLLKEFEEYQIGNIRYDNPPAMNPLDSPDDQKDIVFYPPDPLPINIPGNGFVYSRNIYEPPKSNIPFNNVNYDYNNVYSNPSRSYHNGTYNTYQNAQDTNIVNPYSWSNNFNTNSGNFVQPMTNMNNQVTIDYQSILDNTNENLVNALKLGPKFIDANTPEYNMEPPYAQDF